MAFTYDLSSSNVNTLNISKVRLEIGDTVHNAGVRPDASNLSDEEIALWLSEEGDDIKLASARACEAMASAWSVVADEKIGPRTMNFGEVSKNFEKRAIALRADVRPTVYVY